MAARQTSIITTAAPPAPALAANVETELAVFTSDVVLPTRVEQHPTIITLLLALSTRVSAATTAPRKVFAGIIASLLIQLAMGLSFRNLRTKVARIFFRAAANHIELPFTQRSTDDASADVSPDRNQIGESCHARRLRLYELSS